MTIKECKKSIKYLKVRKICNIFSIDTFVFTNNSVKFILQLLQKMRVPSEL
jgi:hypothetical protein